MTIRNNAPGGGGNDWAIDDVALYTQSGYARFAPSLQVCAGDQVGCIRYCSLLFPQLYLLALGKSIDNGTTGILRV